MPSKAQQNGNGMEAIPCITLAVDLATVIGMAGAAASGIVINGCVFVIFTVFGRGGAGGGSGSTLMRAVSFFGSARLDDSEAGEPLAGGRVGSLIRAASLPGESSTDCGGSVMRTVSFFGSFNGMIGTPGFLCQAQYYLP